MELKLPFIMIIFFLGLMLLMNHENNREETRSIENAFNTSEFQSLQGTDTKPVLDTISNYLDIYFSLNGS